MNRPLKIAVADDEKDTRDYLRELLSRLGHEVLVASDGRQLAELCRASPPDLVVTDVKMPQMDGIEAVQAIARERPLPVILITGHHGPEVLARAATDYVMAYLVKPITQADVEAALSLATLRFAQFQAVRQEAASLRQALEDRKAIERAKGIVMRRLRWDEDEAFRRLRKMASDHNRRVADIAEEVHKADLIFQQLERT